jgi:hypothetical protein
MYVFSPDDLTNFIRHNARRVCNVALAEASPPYRDGGRIMKQGKLRNVEDSELLDNQRTDSLAKISQMENMLDDFEEMLTKQSFRYDLVFNRSYLKYG